MSRLKDKPFTILAVSVDDDRDSLITTLESRKVPGIQTWDPVGWEENPIARLYNVQNIPTWYLIDAKGVIRGRDPFDKELIPAVTTLLPETRP